MPPSIFALVVVAVFGLCAAPSNAAPSRNIDDYVLFAYDEMILKGAVGGSDSGYIHGGDIGVNYADRGENGSPSLSYATLGPVIMDTGRNAVADSVRANNSQGVFFNLFANSVTAQFAATILGSGPSPFADPIIAPGNLPVLPFTPGRALTDSATDVTVGGGQGFPSPHTLAPGAYRDVRVNDGKVLNLGDGTYDMRSLSLGTNVTVNVTDHTVIQIDRGWTINDGMQFGVGTQAGARVLVGALGFDAHRNTVCNFAHVAEVHMQFFAPTGWLDIGGTNRLFGRFWAQRITGDPSNDVIVQEPPDGPPPSDSPRRYQCYEIHRPVMNLPGVSLVDAVGASTVTVKRAKRICAPADVNGRDPAAPLDPEHLTYYTLRQTSPFAAAKATVTTELGAVDVKLAKVDRLLVPTAKSLSTTPAPLVPTIDHYKCYRLSTAKSRTSGLAVTDQFGSITVDVKRPLHLCLATAKNGEPIPVPGASLLCYLIRGTRPEAPPPVIYTHNQFGPDQHGFFGPRDLCIPATVTFQ